MTTRSIMWLGLFTAALAILAGQSLNRYQIPIWDTVSKRYVYPTLGPTLTINNGVLEVVASKTATRSVGKVMAWDAALGAYKIPSTGAALANVAVYVNGFRYTEGVDYTLKGNLVVPQAPTDNWPPPATAVVTVDWEQ